MMWLSIPHHYFDKFLQVVNVCNMWSWRVITNFYILYFSFGFTTHIFCTGIIIQTFIICHLMVKWWPYGKMVILKNQFNVVIIIIIIRRACTHCMGWRYVYIGEYRSKLRLIEQILFKYSHVSSKFKLHHYHALRISRHAYEANPDGIEQTWCVFQFKGGSVTSNCDLLYRRTKNLWNMLACRHVMQELEDGEQL